MLTGLGRGVVRMPVLRAPEIAWPPICRSGIFETGPRWFLEFALGEKPNCETQAGPAILDLPLETLVAWCQAHPDSAPAFVAAKVAFLQTDEEGAPTSSLHPVMKRLIDEFGHCSGYGQPTVATWVPSAGWAPRPQSGSSIANRSRPFRITPSARWQLGKS